MENKKLITSRDLLFLGAVLLLSAALFLFLRGAPKGATAIVERDDEILLTQELATLTEPVEITLTGAGGHSVTLRFSSTGACFTASTCPDHTCIRTGEITLAGQTALCLPARISLRLEGGPTGADAETY